MVTDYSLRLLRKNNLLSFSTYNECVGSDIHIAYKKNNLLVTKNLKIKKYHSTNYDKINPSYSNNDIYTKLMYVNARTYYQLFYNSYKKQVITLGTDKYKLMTSNQYDLLYNEAIIGSDVLSFWQSQGYDISLDNKSSIKLYVNDMEITTNLSIKYNEMVEGIYVNEATKEGLDETFFVKYYSLYDEFKVFLVTKDSPKTIALLYFNGSEIEFINSDNFFKALAEIDDDNALFEILKVGLIALTLTIVFLSYYSFCKVNNVRFQILELYGLTKRNRPLMLLIGNLASSIISFLISFSMLYNIFNQKDNAIMNKYFLNSFYSLFCFKYMLYVYLIVLGIIVGIFTIFVPFILKKKRYSYISK